MWVDNSFETRCRSGDGLCCKRKDRSRGILCPPSPFEVADGGLRMQDLLQFKSNLDTVLEQVLRPAPPSYLLAV
jgi:hypothetical protein